MISPKENPLRAAYWLSEVAPEPLALFRIAFGLSLLHDLCDFAPNIGVFLSDDGILPRAALHDVSAWSVFRWVGSPLSVALVFAIGAAGILAYTLGYRTRVASIVSFVFVVSLHNRNPFITDGGDDLVRNLLFLSIFADLAGCYSLDVWRGARARGNVSGIGLRFLQLHLMLLYFCAARLKFRAGWLKHNVIYRCLQLTGFVRPPGALLARFPALCYVLGLVTLGLEFVFAFLALSPVLVGVCRALAIAAALGVQLGILATMRVGVFTEAMLAANLLFVRPEWLAAGSAWLKARFRLPHVPAPAPNLPAALVEWKILRHRPTQLVTFAFLSFNFLALAWPPFAGRRLPLPSWVSAERQWLWLDQPFGLFDRVYPGPHWTARGAAADARQVDVLPLVVPALIPRVSWGFSRWYKFMFVVQDHTFPYQGLADFLCRRYRQETGTALSSVTLDQTLIQPTYPDEPAAPALTLRLRAQPCPDAIR
jgi:hypothetical protein